MALPAIMRRLFAGDGYGPLLKDDIVSKYISIQDWSNSFDYQPATAVRGADGLLYWSVTQTGPGTGAGAHDPTTDTGVYWSTMPLPTPSLADKSNKAANTEWVKDISSVIIYVNADPAVGSDSNDGLTAATALKTINKALELVDTYIDNTPTIIVAGGTYNEEINVENRFCSIVLTGNVTINGNIGFMNNAKAILSGNYSLTINSNGKSCFYVGRSSGIIVKNINFILSEINSNRPALLIELSSSLQFIDTATIDITISGEENITSYGLLVDYDSYFDSFTADITISGNNIYNCFACVNESAAYIHKILCDMTSSASNDTVLRVDSNSMLILHGADIRSSANCSYVFLIDRNSHLICYEHMYLRQNNPNAYNVQVSKHSGMYVQYGSLLEFDCSVETNRGLTATDCSLINIESSANEQTTIKAYGEYKQWFGLSDRMSVINVNPTTDIVNGAYGKRFQVSNCSIINVYNAGVNRLPGDVEGTIHTSTFSIYS